MRELNHSNIMNLEEVFESDNSLYIIFELLDGGQLHDAIQVTNQLFRKNNSLNQKLKKLCTGYYMDSNICMPKESCIEISNLKIYCSEAKNLISVLLLILVWLNSKIKKSIYLLDVGLQAMLLLKFFMLKIWMKSINAPVIFSVWE